MSASGRERLRVPRRVLDELVGQARAGAPLEVCGLLAGREGRVRRAYPLTNTAARPDFYAGDPAEGLEAYRSMADEGLDPLAIYHSHPTTPARPSAQDIDNANDPEAVYVIVSLLEPRAPSVRAFRIRDGASRELTIETTED